MDWIERFRESVADRYALGPQIGAGGMGVVFRAEDVKHGRSVAVKVLRPEWTTSTGGQRFLREIDIAGGLVHPGIVPLYDSGREGDVLFYVMPLVDGETLQTVMERQGALPPRRAIEIVAEIADALEYAHSEGVTHRDIKPSNILISGRHALLVDFGIAQAYQAASGAPVTESGAAVGTPAYMSPEQLFGEPATARSDIYSLGCVFFELLTGHPPVRAKTPAAIAGAHMMGGVDFTQMASAVPDRLRPVLSRMLAPDPADRFESAESLRAALDELTETQTGGVPWRVTAEVPKSRVRLTSFQIVAATVALVAAVVLGPALLGSDEARAAAAYARGVDHLEASRLGAAEAEFRTAVRLDTAHAMAKHDLALTLYWREATGEISTTAEIPPLALAAVQQSSGLPASDSLRVLGFYRFQEGEYQAARSTFEGLIEEDPDDVYAWLLLGMVEYNDPWLEARQGGGFGPARSLNRSLEAFSAAREIRPGFHLGYGHISDIASGVFMSVSERTADGFHYPQDALVAPWEEPSPEGMEGFLAVPMDSLTWLRRPELEQIDLSEAEAGALRLLDQAVGFLRQWTLFAPELPRPREEWADLLMVERRGLRALGARAEAEGLARIALAQADTALSFRPDTTSAELFRIARLSLAIGDAAEAKVWLERGLTVREAEDASRLEPALANIALAGGDQAQALAILAGSRTQQTFVTADSAPTFDYGSAAEILPRILALGAIGGSGDLIDDAFTRLSEIWAQPSYSSAQIQSLRERNVPPAALALWTQPAARAEWAEALDGPLWTLLARPGPVTAAEIEAADQVDATVPEPTRAFILGSVAQTEGYDALAVRLFSRLDSLTYSLDGLDPGWALETRSYELRSEAYRSLGDAAAAEVWAERFRERRAPASGALAPGAG